MDNGDSIDAYLERKKSHTKGFIYFPPTVAYENFTDDFSNYPVRVDVESWDHFTPDGVKVDWPALPRHKTLYAAIEIERAYYDLIHSVLAGEQDTGFLSEEIDESARLVEGAAMTAIVNAYEHSQKARTKCIEHHGWNYAVCGYNMADLYGKFGVGFIHVHHLRELRSLGGEYEVDPIKDLIPVCPNRHAILHTSSPAMSIKQLRKILS